MSPTRPPTLVPAIDRTERNWLFGAIVFGAILRLSFPGRMAIEHFDEGVYASNFWFGGNPYPAQYLYAPPLLPAAIEWTMILASLVGIKPTGFIPMIPCLMAGIAMIPSIWWIGRRWFGPTAGLLSAWLVATSDFHVCYSRAALTDVPVSLFMLWAVYFIWSAYSKIDTSSSQLADRGKPRQKPLTIWPWKEILLAGGFTGLAWWTKYNGWLPLAIGLAGGAFWQLLKSSSERKVGRIAICWLSISAVAFLVWSPVLWGLQDGRIGGYAAVAANHSQYIVGFKGWAGSAWTQMKNLGSYENPLDVLYGPFVEFLAPADPFDDGQPGIVTIYEFLFRSLTPLVFPMLAGIVSLWVCIRYTLIKQAPSQMIAASLVVAWFVGMSVATPFYYPYPRLVFPWLCSVWICLGLFGETFVRRDDAENPSSFRLRAVRIFCVVLGLISLARTASHSAFAWQDRSNLQAVSKEIAQAISEEVVRMGKRENDSIVYVFAKPAIVFGLNAEGNSLALPAKDFGATEFKTDRLAFLVVSGREISKDDKAWSSSHLSLVSDGFESGVGHLVWNDGYFGSLRETFYLYRFVP